MLASHRSAHIERESCFALKCYDRCSGRVEGSYANGARICPWREPELFRKRGDIKAWETFLPLAVSNPKRLRRVEIDISTFQFWHKAFSSCAFLAMYDIEKPARGPKQRADCGRSMFSSCHDFLLAHVYMNSRCTLPPFALFPEATTTTNFHPGDDGRRDTA